MFIFFAILELFADRIRSARARANICVSCGTCCTKEENKIKQAGAELCQAQEKLGLAKPALPSKKLWLSFI
jgi:hypothetical protein